MIGSESSILDVYSGRKSYKKFKNSLAVNKINFSIEKIKQLVYWGQMDVVNYYHWNDAWFNKTFGWKNNHR